MGFFGALWLLMGLVYLGAKPTPKTPLWLPQVQLADFEDVGHLYLSWFYSVFGLTIYSMLICMLRAKFSQWIVNSNQLIYKFCSPKRMSPGGCLIIIISACAGLIARAADGLKGCKSAAGVACAAVLGWASGRNAMLSAWLLLLLPFSLLGLAKSVNGTSL